MARRWRCDGFEPVPSRCFMFCVCVHVSDIHGYLKYTLRTLTRHRRTSMFCCVWVAHFGCMVLCSSLRLGCSACFRQFFKVCLTLGILSSIAILVCVRSFSHTMLVSKSYVFVVFLQFSDAGGRSGTLLDPIGHPGQKKI